MKRLIHIAFTVGIVCAPASVRADWFAFRSWVESSAMQEISPGNRFYSAKPGEIQKVLFRKPPSTLTMENEKATYRSKLTGMYGFNFYGGALQDPLRIVDGKEINLIPVFSGLENSLPIPKEFDSWEWVIGTVKQAKAGRAMLVTTGTEDAPGRAVMVLHYPVVLADGDHFSAIAMKVPNTSYTGTDHSVATVTTYDYGLLPIRQRQEAFVAEYQAALGRALARTGQASKTNAAAPIHP